jgi:hypothetical protein
VVPFVADLSDARADMIITIARPVDGAAAILTDDEVPHLGILSVFPDTGDTCPAMGGFVVFGHLEVAEIPLYSTNSNAKLENGLKN